MKPSDPEVSRNVFKKLVDDLFTTYKERLGTVIQADEHKSVYYDILKIESLLTMKHGKSQHIFGRTDTDRQYYSIGYVINSILKENEGKIIDLDVSDFLYKRCIKYKRGDQKIRVLNEFFQVLGYRNLDHFCLTTGESNELDTPFSMYSGDQPEDKDTLLDNLKGGWWLYFYNNEDYTRRSTVARAILEIDSYTDMRIINKASPESLNYKGGIDKNQRAIQGILYLKFFPVNKREVRNLQIALHVSPDVLLEVALGHYSSVDSNHHLIRGSLAIEKISGYEKGNFEPGRFTKENFNKLHKNLQDFFEDRSLSFNRLPNSIYKMVEFGEWIADYKIKQRVKRYQNKLQKKKLFISCPINSIDEKYFGEMKDTVKSITDYFLHSLSFEGVYSFISKLDEPNDNDKIPSFLEYEEIVKNYVDSSCHLVIYPRNIRTSGILFEVGWSMGTQNPVTIFEQAPGRDEEDKRSQIPQLVLGACECKDSTIIKIPYTDKEDLMDKIKANGTRIFNNHNNNGPLDD